MGLLNVQDLWVQYGKLTALRNFSIDVECGATVAIIGSNGAGKTTLLRDDKRIDQANEGGDLFRWGIHGALEAP